MSKPSGAMGSPYCDGSMTEMMNKAASIMACENREEPKKPAEKPVTQVSACPTSATAANPAPVVNIIDGDVAFTKDAKKELMSMSSKVLWELEELSAGHATFTLKTGQRVVVRPA